MHLPTLIRFLIARSRRDEAGQALTEWMVIGFVVVAIIIVLAALVSGLGQDAINNARNQMGL